jgi:ankyrin repeat protein
MVRLRRVLCNFEGVEVFIPDPNPRSLSEAIREGDSEEARRILRSGAKINIWDEDKTFPLFEAISSRHADFAEELLAAGADPKLSTPGGDTALMQATWYSELGIAKALLDRGAPAQRTITA